MQPARAAKIFNIREEDFTEINEPVGESSLWRTIFGSCFFALSTNADWKDQLLAFKAVKIVGADLDFLNTESLGVQPPPMCRGYKQIATGINWIESPVKKNLH